MFFVISGFNEFAEYDESLGRKVLISNGYRFYRYGKPCNGRHYWKCSAHKQFLCASRAITKIIDGYDKVQFRAHHNHPARFNCH